MLASMNACRLHGEGCHVAWGYDRAHTDSTRPYTTEELAERLEGPHYYAYPTLEAYQEGYALWLALRRDARPTYLEGLVALAVRLAPHAPKLQYLPRHHQDPACPVARALAGLRCAPSGFALALAQVCGCHSAGA
jgi:hypothetical protein